MSSGQRKRTVYHFPKMKVRGKWHREMAPYYKLSRAFTNVGAAATALSVMYEKAFESWTDLEELK